MTTPPFPDAPDGPYAVTPLELFFDLVFVFAVAQLSHHLLAPISGFSTSCGVIGPQ